MARLFVAAWPSADVKLRLAALPAVDEPGVRPVAASNWHVTLKFVGDVGPRQVSSTLDALAAADLPVADAVLGPRVVRLGSGQLVIPTRGVDGLARKVRAATPDVGQPAQHRFVGHLTVARTKRNAHSALLGAEFEAAWTIGEIALVESTLDPGGAVYKSIATFPTT